MKITIPVSNEASLPLFDEYLDRKLYKFKKKKNGDMWDYTIWIDEAEDAYWIGCNHVSIMNGIYAPVPTLALNQHLCEGSNNL